MIKCCDFEDASIIIYCKTSITAPFNNMRTLKFKAQLTNAFYATINQMFGGSSQLLTSAECVVIKSLSTVQKTKQCSAVVGSWEEPPTIWLTVAKNAIVGWALNFRVGMLLKGAENKESWKKGKKERQKEGRITESKEKKKDYKVIEKIFVSIVKMKYFSVLSSWHFRLVTLLHFFSMNLFLTV